MAAPVPSNADGSDSNAGIISDCPEQTAGDIAAQPEPPNQQSPPPGFRFRLFGGLLAVLAMRISGGQLAHKVACRAGQTTVSRVASVLLADTGEGLHRAALQFRAACDNVRAARCFSRAVELKHGPSHAELSYMFIGNCSMPKDLQVAFSIAERGARLGCNDCKAALASCLRFVWRDEERAVQLAKESASTGNSWGCSELGLLLQHGIGVDRNVEQAVAYTSRAARLGNAWARHNLGLMYAAGCGVERDYAQACSLFRMSAEQGISAAQNHLASLYFRGLGVQKDEDAAKFWWSRSASQGDEVALQFLTNGYDCDEDDVLA